MKILIIGATGMVGQSLLREALLDTQVSQIVSLGRSPLPQRHEKLQQIQCANLNQLNREALAQLQNLDACFFCLGVTSSGMSEADYRQLTYDLTLNVATQLLANNPQMTFVYISGAGADSTEKGKTMWANVRGATENALQRLPFKAVYCLRPAMIQPMFGVQSKTASYRYFYRLMRPFFPCYAV